MNPFRNLAISVRRRLAVRFGLAFLLVIFFGLTSIRFYTNRTAEYRRILLAPDKNTPVMFSPQQTEYLNKQLSAMENRMVRELILSNILVVIIFSAFSYLLAQGLFDSLTESIEREKQFLDDASHELKTPLTAITAITETTLRSRSNTPSEYEGALTQVLEESKRLSGTLNDLLFLSKSDNRQITLRMERQNLAEIVRSVSGSMQHVADQKSINIEVDGTEKDLYVQADGSKIRQLLTILLDNAIKYSENNSKVIIFLEDKPKVRISVTDFGRGIASKDLPHIFERFYRSDKSRADKGNGLGLSIAQWIATAHDLKIDVKSRVGKGSTFSITF